MKRIMFLVKIGLAIIVGLGSINALATTAASTANTGQFINGVVAIVNDGVITQAELNQATDEAAAQAKAQGMPVPDRISLERQVLQSLISEKVALQLAALNNIAVSNDQVQNAIAGVAARNNITIAQMQSALSQQGVSFASYEATIKKQLTLNQLEQQAVANSIIVTPGEIDSYLAMQNAASGTTEYHVQHIMLPLPSDPTAANLQKVQQQGQAIVQKINQGMPFSTAAMKYSSASDALSGGDLGFKTVGQLPSAFSSMVSNMQVGEIKGPFESDGAFHIIKLIAKKNSNVPTHYIEEYRINGIFMKTSPIMTADHVEQQLANLRSEIMAGSSFSKLAEDNSEDPISAKAGGDMGWQDPTELNPAFAKAIDSTPIGKISQPFETDKGWYIIQVVDKRKVDDTENYERMMAQQAIFQRKAEQAVATWQAQIRGASYVQILDPALQMPDAQS